MNYLAHVSEDGKSIQSLKEHLLAVSDLAGKFAGQFGAADYARKAGLIHDLGKATEAFQNRLLRNGKKVDHSTAGAIELYRIGMIHAALCVAGHHGGIPNVGSRVDSSDDATLLGRLKREPGKEIPDYRAFIGDLDLEPVELPFTQKNNFSGAFFTRMVFSCLVDADFLDTELFMKSGAVDRGKHDDLLTLKERLDNYVEPWWDAKTDLNKKRTEILKNCIEAGSGEKGLYSLTVPTGGGKTISSLAFALEHASRHAEIQRVVYVIPYTSIIEQTANTFRDILGADNVIEHHSNFDYDTKGDLADDVKEMRFRLACENWDAPVIVTTNVQFFESLYSNKTSRCRKLHNLANSVIIFDEAQMIPLPYLKPCIAAIAELVENYGCTALLCTATQPSLNKFFPDDMSAEEICRDTASLYEFFRRTTIKHIGPQTINEIAEQMAEFDQVLCIVNTKKQAQDLFMMLPEDGRFHLSTLLTPTDRSGAIKEIKIRLKNQLPCRVASTSLVEAGVDIDFPYLYKTEAGLDSIIQAAGRCNREGKAPAEKSLVYVFRTEDRPPTAIMQNTVVMQEVAETHEDVASPDAIKAYFDNLHDFKDELLDKKKIIAAFDEPDARGNLPFRTISQEFNLIEEDTRLIFIPPKEDEHQMLWRLENDERSRKLMRKVTLFSVAIRKKQWERLISAGATRMLDDEIAVLTDTTLYNGKETGLSINLDNCDGLFI